MSRFALATLAGIAGGFALWFVVGFAAGSVLSRLHGNREGAAGMAGFFIIGPAGGVLGFALTFWLAHRLLGRGAAPVSASTVVVQIVLALAVTVAVGWGLIQAVVAVRKPDPWSDLAKGEAGAVEFDIHVPASALGGKPVSEAVSLAFKTSDDDGDHVVPVTWREARAGGGVRLTGSVPLDHRPRGQYFVVTHGDESIEVWAKLPTDMHKKGSWDDTLYLGRDPALAMADRISITSRYVPVRP
jgi:hypothetical protein